MSVERGEMVQTYAQRHIAEPQRKKRRKAAASRSADADGTDEPVSTAITTTTSLARARPRHSPLAAGYVQSPAAAGEAEPARSRGVPAEVLGPSLATACYGTVRDDRSQRRCERVKMLP